MTGHALPAQALVPRLVRRHGAVTDSGMAGQPRICAQGSVRRVGGFGMIPASPLTATPQEAIVKIAADCHIHSRISCDQACMIVADLVREAAAKGIGDFELTESGRTATASTTPPTSRRWRPCSTAAVSAPRTYGRHRPGDRSLLPRRAGASPNAMYLSPLPRGGADPVPEGNMPLAAQNLAHRRRRGSILSGDRGGLSRQPSVTGGGFPWYGNVRSDGRDGPCQALAQPAHGNGAWQCMEPDGGRRAAGAGRSAWGSLALPCWQPVPCGPANGLGARRWTRQECGC